MEAWDVIVVGGGAAGLFTAIHALTTNSDLRVGVLDGARRFGAKILVSGGGRCNVTNRVVQAADFFGGSRKVVHRVLQRWSAEDTVAWFAHWGVPLHEEVHGKLFPDSERARTVLDALLGAARSLGADLCPDHRVTHIERGADGFIVGTSRGARRARRLVLAAGGRSLPKSGSDGSGYDLARRLGHTVVPTVPALAPLVLSGTLHPGLSGISTTVELTLRTTVAKPVRVVGDLLWTHFGVSGPAALDISGRWARARANGDSPTLAIRFYVGASFEDLERAWHAQVHEHPRLRLHKALLRWTPGPVLPARVVHALLAELQIDGDTPLAHVSRGDRRRLCASLLDWPLMVVDTRGYAFAEVTSGGVPVVEIDSATMASRCCPGAYLVGELLDVDGRLGGFNFQWAWSSGHVAGTALGRPGRPPE